MKRRTRAPAVAVAAAVKKRETTTRALVRTTVMIASEIKLNS